MSRIKLQEPGSCYILSNAAMPGLLKIGATTLDPMERARQLSAATAAATPFHLIYARRVSDVNVAEQAVHTALVNYRVNENREFFQVSVYKAAQTLDIICDKIGFDVETPTPMAELFASFAPSDNPNLNAEEQRACRNLEKKIAHG